jgi:Domain of unknown function (DUF4259)
MGADMGSWGTCIFENDDACDYAADVASTGDVSILERTFDLILETEGYLEAPIASEALTAADIVARLRGRPGEQTAYTAEIDRWVAGLKLVPSDQLLEKARRSVERIMTAPSELLELCQESQDFASWKRTIDGLMNRL